MEIFATIGPACADEETQYEMMNEGMTGIRLNLSHTPLDKGRDMLSGFYAARERYKKPVDLLVDLQGPELRIGKLISPLDLSQGDRADIPVSESVANLIKPGMSVLLDDGKIYADILDKSDASLSLSIKRGGILKSNKSIKIEGVDTPLPTLTEQDKKNIKLAKESGVSAVMLPFVRGAGDILELRSVTKESFRIFAKIENLTGVEHIKEIVSALDPAKDMLVIARGDLGNAMPLWELPRIQKVIEAACHEASMPYLVVTQLLASMTENEIPTRAEVSDVYHAIYHGAAALMVTNETAVGKHPVEVIKYMKKIAEQF